MVECMLTILDGSTFVVSDEVGDVGRGPEGVFADDTRMLSRCRLLIDDETPLLLTSRAVDYFSATHYLRNAPTPRISQDTLSVSRERFVSDAVSEHLLLSNESMSELSFAVELELAADFADIISVKAHDFAFGDPASASPLPSPLVGVPTDASTLVIEDDEGYRTTIRFSRPFEMTGEGAARFSVSLAPHARWELTLDISFGSNVAVEPLSRSRTFGSELPLVRETLAAWKLSVPRLTSPALELQRVYDRSIADLASLRLKGIETIGELPAAGMPWFMTVFGRDTLITSLQTLMFGPELAIGALRSLAALQADADDPGKDAEPGKIIHELRRGKAATNWFPHLLTDRLMRRRFSSSCCQRCGDGRPTRPRSRARARSSLGRVTWIDEYGDRDGDGFVEYERRSRTEASSTSRGKTPGTHNGSGTARFAVDAHSASRGARVRLRRSAADRRARRTGLGRRRPCISSPRHKRNMLRAAVQRGILDRRTPDICPRPRQKQDRVDALCSNLGHLLWSGIVLPHRLPQIAAELSGPDLWSGWGVRTMGAAEAAYNPLSYHNGTVWPHDTALAAWGLARSGYTDFAQLFARSLIEAAATLDYALPEVFAGYARSETAFPVAYPTAAKPQAWAAGAPVLCLTLLLGLRPDPIAERPRELELPRQLPTGSRAPASTGCEPSGRVWTVEVRNGTIAVNER